MNKRKRLLYGTLLFSVTILFSGCEKGGEHSQSEAVAALPVVTVESAQVREMEVRSRIEVVGTVEAVQRASISSRITGQIIDFPVALGSRVNQGDLLIRISAAEMAAKVLRAEAQLSQARRNLAREKKLQKQGASTRETVKELEDLHRIAEAAYKEAQTMLDYTTIRAPFAGTVTRKIANSGDLATPGKPLLMLENGDDLQILAQVPEALLLNVAVGDELFVTLPAASLSLVGKVAEVAPAADPVSRTAPVKIQICSNPDIRVGQFARIGLEGEGETALLVPQSAVLVRGQMEMVFVVDEAKNIARMRLVKTGVSVRGEVEILSGLDFGERIVTSRVNKLQDGQPLAGKDT